MRFVLVLALLLSGCGSGGVTTKEPVAGDDDDDTTPQPTATPGTLADPAAAGPFGVGIRTIELTDSSRGRTFKVDVWYPIPAGANDGSENVYELDSALGTLAEVPSPARRNAAPAAGARPLVLFSHGFGGIRFQSYFLTEHLASHGYVVAAPDHPGNTLADFLLLGSDEAAIQSSMDRPKDMTFTLDAMLTGVTGVPAIDPARIASTGHSFGGWTSLEVARLDPRIAAIVPMAPGFRNGATPDFVATLARPMAIFGGSLDETCEFTDQQAAYDFAQAPKHLVRVNGAGHLDFSNLCEIPLATLFVDDGCDPANIEPATVHARTKTIATSFLGAFLMENAGYEPHLDEQHVLSLGNVTYWRD